MYLYNIHTHKACTSDAGYQVRCILNTYPDTFYAQKESSPDVWFSCGIHPWHTFEAERKMDLLRSIVSQDRVVAIGEAGLDKLRGESISRQIEVFSAQIELSEQIRKPLIIHCVKAWEELISLYKSYRPDMPWIIHGYRGNVEQTKQLVKLGFRFSIGSKFNRNSLAYIPLDSLFCETDDSNVSICRIYSDLCTISGLGVKLFCDCIEGNSIKMFYFSH